jgi:hypothetical protein
MSKVQTWASPGAIGVFPAAGGQGISRAAGVPAWPPRGRRRLARRNHPRGGRDPRGEADTAKMERIMFGRWDYGSMNNSGSIRRF